MVLDPPNILIEDGNNNYDDPNDAEENEYNHDDNVSGIRKQFSRVFERQYF